MMVYLKNTSIFKIISYHQHNESQCKVTVPYQVIHKKAFEDANIHS